MFKRVERVALLFDFYGKLLTEKQQEFLSLYYDQDLSLGEIAEEFKISRQAVHDILKRAEKALEEYEEKLELVQKFNTNREKLNIAVDLINKIENDISLVPELKKTIADILESE